jgi:hypothetical protein
VDGGEFFPKVEKLRVKKPRKRRENEFFPNVKGCISWGLGRHLLRGGKAMACFFDDYGVFLRGLFSDEGFSPVRGWGEQWPVVGGQLKQGERQEDYFVQHFLFFPRFLGVGLWF